MNINSIYYLFISLFSTYLASLLKTAFYANSCFFLFSPQYEVQGNVCYSLLLFFLIFSFIASI